MAIDTGKLHEFLGKFVGDLGATTAAGNVVIGHNLGLYKALAAAPGTAEELAAATQTNPRYVAEWLRGQAAGGYVQYDPADDSYSMTEEQAFALTNPDGGVYVPGAFVLALGALKAVPRITEAFRSGAGMGWNEQDEDVFTGCEQFFRPGYIANLIPSWIPALDGGRPSCGPARRWPTSAAGSARPRSCSPRSTRTRGSPDLTTTTSRSRWPASAPVTRASPTGSPSRSPRRRRSPGPATIWPPPSIACTTWATRSPRPGTSAQALKPDGTWLIVEPMAADDIAGNLNPVGRVYYSFSTLLCVPNALSQPGGYALGAQAGEAAIRQVVTDAGLTRFRRAAETPFNLVYEVRP